LAKPCHISFGNSKSISFLVAYKGLGGNSELEKYTRYVSDCEDSVL
jgi:hypothetical protein